MIPELGTFAIILALCFSLIQGTFVFFTPTKNNNIFITISFSQFLFLVIAMLCLIVSFITNDMTVFYVREHSHSLLPLFYRIGAAWGGHEGSLLLWCLILSLWTFSFSLLVDKRLSLDTVQSILAILGWINFGFILFLITTSNPFHRDFPTQLINGADLTPILQDPGLIFHPPMLYMGYVGFAVGFAFAISALLKRKLNKTEIQACRPWIILPWSFLSAGIVLGSWWAYRELGWGGWWFWDPVENASLLPWLSATALIHSLIVSEKRDAFKGWTILLAIITFTLSLLGTFLVRSGVLVSVHAFASDPTRGIFLLSYLTLIIGGGLTLYAARIHLFYQSPEFDLFSRETFLLMNTIFLLTLVATIVIGTLYPIVLDALNVGKISIGEPYFNSVFVPLILPLLLLMGIAPHIHWQKHPLQKIKDLILPFVVSALLGFFSPYLLGFPFYFLTSVGISLSIWIIIATLKYAYKRINAEHTLSLKYLSMIIAHLGIAVMGLGIVINKSYSEERQVKIAFSEKVELSGYTFTFKNLKKINSSNYQSIVANFLIQKNQRNIDTLSPEQRTYYSNGSLLSKPAVSFNLIRDLYLALGSSLPDGTWTVRIYYKPFVRWIWFGGFMLLFSGLLSLVQYSLTRKQYAAE